MNTSVQKSTKLQASMSDVIGKVVQLHASCLEHYLKAELYARLHQIVDKNNPRLDVDDTHCCVPTDSFWNCNCIIRAAWRWYACCLSLPSNVGHMQVMCATVTHRVPERQLSHKNARWAPSAPPCRTSKSRGWSAMYCGTTAPSVHVLGWRHSKQASSGDITKQYSNYSKGISLTENEVHGHESVSAELRKSVWRIIRHTLHWSANNAHGGRDDVLKYLGW